MFVDKKSRTVPQEQKGGMLWSGQSRSYQTKYGTTSTTHARKRVTFSRLSRLASKRFRQDTHQTLQSTRIYRFLVACLVICVGIWASLVATLVLFSADQRTDQEAKAASWGDAEGSAYLDYDMTLDEVVEREQWHEVYEAERWIH